MWQECWVWENPCAQCQVFGEWESWGGKGATQDGGLGVVSVQRSIKCVLLTTHEGKENISK